MEYLIDLPLKCHHTACSEGAKRLGAMDGHGGHFSRPYILRALRPFVLPGLGHEVGEKERRKLLCYLKAPEAEADVEGAGMLSRSADDENWDCWGIVVGPVVCGRSDA